MKTTNIIRLLALVGILITSPVAAHAETLSWNAVTTYADGSGVGSAAVTYTAVWSPSSSLSSPTTLASSISSTSTNFNIDIAGMPRGATIYFAVKSTVVGVDSAYSAPLPWNVPAQPGTPKKNPSSPKRFRIK